MPGVVPVHWDHPRVCGEKRKYHCRYARRLGSPPRMRGKTLELFGGAVVDGITPAYARKSICLALPITAPMDHPRVCGEKPGPLSAILDKPGSPPRMRGKDQACSRWRYPDGITPAYAGKRIIAERAAIFSRDHPRVCGEKTPVQVMVEQPKGSPPHVRGKVPDPCIPTWQEGITPAYAGKSRCCFR